MRVKTQNEKQRKSKTEEIQGLHQLLIPAHNSVHGGTGENHEGTGHSFILRQVLVLSEDTSGLEPN